jgi:hypothetical protein
MYHYLTNPLRRRIQEVLRFSFGSNPRHRDVVDHIRLKYEFRERPQKGIVLQGSSGSPVVLSANNFVGTMFSYVMMAKVDDFAGTALEWVKEDSSVEHTGFPSEAGIYYIQIEELNAPNSLPTYQFYVDPLLTVRDELVLVSTGVENQAVLLNAPAVDGTIHLYADGYELLDGEALRITAPESLEIVSDFGLGLPVGQVKPILTTGTGPFTFTGGEILALEIDDQPVIIDEPFDDPITYTAADLADMLLDEFIDQGVDGSTYEIQVVDNTVQITSNRSIRIDEDTLSTANPILGFDEGFVPVEVTGISAKPVIPKDEPFTMVVNGLTIQVPLHEGFIPLSSFVNQITPFFAHTGLTIEIIDSGDYVVDPETGAITLFNIQPAGTEIVADYRYPIESRGPFPIGRGNTANNDAIPGVVLAFGNQLEDGDVIAVVVDQDRSDVADVYGGKFDLSLDIDIIARDSMTRSELADLCVMYLWNHHRERLSEEGIEITSLSHGGESEEPYDDNADDYYYTANVSLSVMTDWEIHIAKPLQIRRIVHSSFAEDAQRAADSSFLRQGSLLAPVDPTSTLYDHIYIVNKSGKYERLR